MRPSFTLGLRAAAYCLADEVSDIEAWGRENQKDPGLVARMRENGLWAFHRAGDKRVEALSLRAARACLERAHCDPDQVDLVVYFHTLQLSTVPAPDSVCSFLRRQLGMERAVGFAVSQQNCVSFL